MGAAAFESACSGAGRRIGMHIGGLTEDGVFLEDFSLVKKAGEHSSLGLKLLAPDALVQDLLGKVGEKITALPLKNQNEPIFKGIVTQASLRKGYAGNELEIAAVSESIELDEEGKKKLFQNPEKKLGDILSVLDLHACGLELAAKFKDAVCEAVICQNEETDFQFLRRMAALAGWPLWLDDMNIKLALVVAGCVSDKKVKFESDLMHSLRRIRAWKKPESALVASAQFVNPGFLATLPDDSTVWRVESVHGRLEHGVDLYEYELGEYEEPEVKLDEPAWLPALKLTGRVAAADDPENLGRVRVQFEEIEDETPDDKKLWIPYRPGWAGKNSGIVFIPDKDDLVEAFFINGQLYCASALREHALAEECQKVADKAICNNTGQRIFWKEESLELLAAENRLYMDKEKIELTVGENLLRLDKDTILLQTPRTKVSLKGDALRLETEGALESIGQKACKIETGKEGSFNCGGQLLLSASGKAQIKGSGVNVDGGGGNVNISGMKINLS